VRLHRVRVNEQASGDAGSTRRDRAAITDHDGELDEIVATLESADLRIAVTEDDKPALQLTERDAQVGSSR
jgi:hypothetical protein